MSTSDDIQQAGVEPIEVLAPDRIATASHEDWGALVEIIATIMQRKLRDRAQSQNQADARAAN
jgi:hypothetical protein